MSNEWCVDIGMWAHSKAGLIRALKESDFRVSDWAKDMLGHDAFTVALEEYELELVLTTVADLGFKEGATFRKICDRAKARGLELCPAEVGAQLRRQYQDQPQGEGLLIAMERITDSDGCPDVFIVEHDGDGLWLRSIDGDPGDHWNPDDRWVFVRGK
ncbi:MAG: hypothetical protein ABII13_00355 [Patescibacteria group bacterium]|nr:hypothetical protein [Patescibacteria group bacterium]MBU2508812.1 hypothetical protein [Patescibacteria group bacterium]